MKQVSIRVYLERILSDARTEKFALQHLETQGGNPANFFSHRSKTFKKNKRRGK